MDCVEGMRALEAESVDLVIADPPYDIGVQDSAWDTVPHYLEWSRTWLAQVKRLLRPDGQLFIYGSPQRLWISRLKIMAADEFGFTFKQHISWCYKQGGDARLSSMQQYAVRMEHVEWFIKAAASGPLKHTFNASVAAEPYSPEERKEALAKGVGRVTAEALDNGRPPRNWFEIPRENSRSVERRYGSHPSMKPLALCSRIVGVHSNPGDTVVIPFGGSGSECVAAARLGRKVICFENDPGYCAIIRRRLRGHFLDTTGSPATAEEEQDTVPQPEEAPAVVTELGPLVTSARFTSGYKGVFRHGRSFVAKIRKEGRLVTLGTFERAVDAAIVFQRADAAHNAEQQRLQTQGASPAAHAPECAEPVAKRANKGRAPVGALLQHLSTGAAVSWPFTASLSVANGPVPQTSHPARAHDEAALLPPCNVGCFHAKNMPVAYAFPVPAPKPSPLTWGIFHSAMMGGPPLFAQSVGQLEGNAGTNPVSAPRPPSGAASQLEAVLPALANLATPGSVE